MSELQQMYKGVPFSPILSLTQDIGDGDTVIYINDTSSLPEGPNLVTIGMDEEAETVLYAVKAMGQISGCTRGVEGTAKAWQQNEIVGRNFTNKDYETIIANILKLNDEKLEKILDATENNLVSISADGTLKDSGKKASDFENAGEAEKVSIALENHKKDASNPHKVTAEQVGADAKGSAQAVREELESHAGDNQIHVTSEEKQSWNGKADSSELESHTGDSEIHVTSFDKDNWNGKSKVERFSAKFLSNSWVGESAPFSQEIALEGMLSSDSPLIDLSLSSPNEAQISKNEIEAFLMVGYVEAAEGKIILKCYDGKPTTDFTISIEVVR